MKLAVGILVLSSLICVYCTDTLPPGTEAAVNRSLPLRPPLTRSFSDCQAGQKPDSVLNKKIALFNYQTYSLLVVTQYGELATYSGSWQPAYPENGSKFLVQRAPGYDFHNWVMFKSVLTGTCLTAGTNLLNTEGTVAVNNDLVNLQDCSYDSRAQIWKVHDCFTSWNNAWYQQYEDLGSGLCMSANTVDSSKPPYMYTCDSGYNNQWWNVVS